MPGVIIVLFDEEEATDACAERERAVVRLRLQEFERDDIRKSNTTMILSLDRTLLSTTTTSMDMTWRTQRGVASRDHNEPLARAFHHFFSLGVYFWIVV
jgi:hypothetical protein